MSDAVIVALITGGFTIVTSLIGYLMHTNKREHNLNTGKLDRVLEAAENLKHGHERIESKIDNHINDHAKGNV